MRKLVFLHGLCLAYSICSIGQGPGKQFHLDSAESRRLLNKSYSFVQSAPDSALQYAFAALKLAEKTSYDHVRIHSRRVLGMTTGFTGNYVQALIFLLEAKSIAESADDRKSIESLHHMLGNLYRWQKDFNKSAYHYRVAISMQDSSINPYLIESNLAMIFTAQGKLDSALLYAQRAYANVLRSKTRSSYAVVLSTLGKVHQQMGQEGLGKNFMTMAVQYALEKKEPRNSCFVFLDLADFYARAGRGDSSIYYAQQVLLLPQAQTLKPQRLEAAKRLSLQYTGLNTDSAFVYLQMANRLEEEMMSTEKQQQMQAMYFAEELRQQKMAAERELEAAERRQNLQYAGIFLGLVTLVLFFLLMSHSVLAGQRTIRFMGILLLLVVFEFLNLLLHPFLASITHHQPVYMLLLMVALAALLIPFHHKMEHWLLKRMVEKNNHIRLKQARRTIQELEGDKPVHT